MDRSTWESDARPASANEVLPPTDLTRNVLFLAVHNSSIGDLVTHSLTESLTDSVTFDFDITE